MTGTALRSPIDGGLLRQDGPNSLVSAASGERWPLLDGIAYLRTGRSDLVRASVAAVDACNPDEATALLLQDRDDWAPRAPAELAVLRKLVTQRAALTFRDAMRMLALGPVADYFAHRWSDPTFLSGLALAEAYWPRSSGDSPPRVFELACGAGHFLRAFAGHSASVAGGDVVFAKLWLARHWIAPDALLVCFDAAQPWPLPDAAADVVFCHDALYFLPDKPAVAAEMRRVAGAGGRMLCGHAHNARAANHSAGMPLTAEDYAGLFEPAVLYDDAELTAALVAGRTPRSASVAALASAAAISLAAGSACTLSARPVSGGLAIPAPGASLRRNPLYTEAADGSCVRRFPTPRYADEYAELATYPAEIRAAESATAGADPATDAMIRRRVWLDLPARW